MPDPGQGTKGPTSAGTTDDQGRFILKCEDGRAGAAVGWHKVVVNDMKVRVPRATRHGAGDQGKSKTGNADDEPAVRVIQSRVPDPYTASGRTPLTIEVTASKKDYPLELK